MICDCFANFVNIFLAATAACKEARHSIIDLFGSIFIQQQTSANCRWSTIICSTSECSTEVVSHVHFIQEMTSPTTFTGIQKVTQKNSLYITSAVSSPGARVQPALISSHRPCRDAVLRCKHHRMFGALCTKFYQVPLRDALGW